MSWKSRVRSLCSSMPKRFGTTFLSMNFTMLSETPSQQSGRYSAVMAIDIAQVNILLSPTRKEGEMQAYCMKCRAKKEMKDTRSIVMKNGRPATQGLCTTCGTKMFRIGK